MPDPRPPRAATDRPSEEPSDSADAGAEELDAAQRALVDAAREEERAHPDDIERVIGAWKRAALRDPTRRDPHRELARVLRAAQRWNALVAALKQEEEQACRSDDERVEVLLEMATVYRDRLHLDVACFKTLSRVLSYQPENRMALEELSIYHEAMRNWRELVDVLDRRARLLDAPADRVAVYKRIAHLCRERWRNLTAAVSALEKAFELDPDDAEVVDGLVRAYETRRDWLKLMLLRRREMERVTDPGERLQEALRLAELASDRVRKTDIAISAWAEVLALDPDNTRALGELESLYQRNEQWEKLIQVNLRQLSFAETEADQITCLKKLGFLYAEKVGQTREAIDTWKQVLAIDPEHRYAWQALKKLYVAENAWDELERVYAAADKLREFVRLLETHVHDAEAEARVGFWERIAIIYRDRLDQPQRAIRAYDEILAADSQHEGALDALIPLCERTGDHAKLARLVEARYERATHDAERLEHSCRLASLYERRLEDPGVAYAWWRRAFELAWSSSRIRGEVERLAAALDSWEPLVECYERVTRKVMEEAPDDVEGALPLLLETARVQEDQLGQREVAMETYRRVLAIRPSSPVALDALERIYRNEGRHADLMSVYEKKLALVEEPGRRRELLMLSARLSEEELGDDDSAVSCCWKVISEIAPDRDALDILRRIYERREAWSELADVLQRQRDLVERTGDEDDAERERLLALDFELARIHAEQLADPAEAISRYRGILERDREHVGARSALESYFDDPAHELAAATVLHPIYQAEGNDEKLARAYEILVRHADSADDKLRMLHELADIFELRLDSNTAALRALGLALRAAPSDVATIERLHTLAERTDAWQELAEALRNAISQPLSLGQQLDLRCRLGLLYKDRLDEHERAVRTFTRVLDLSPSNQTAIASLEALHQQAGEWTAAAELLRRRRELASSAAEVAELDCRLAELCASQLDDTPGAIQLYLGVLEDDPSHPAALAALDAMIAEGQPADDEQRRALHLRLARFREHELRDVRAAEAHYVAALEIDPDDAHARSALVALRETLERYEELLALAEAAAGSDEQLDIGLELGELCERRLGDTTEAVRAYKLALEVDPGCGRALAALERLHENLQQHEEYIEVLELRLAVAAEDRERIEIYKKMSDAWERGRDNPARAAECLQEILLLDESDLETYRALAHLYRRQQRWQPLVDTLQRHVFAADDDAEVTALLCELARIFDDRLEYRDRANDTYDEILLRDLDDVPDEPTTLDRLLKRSHENAQDDLSLLLTERLAELEQDPVRRGNLLLEEGALCRDAVSDPERAVDCYSRALDAYLSATEQAVGALCLRALEAIDSILTGREEWTPLVASYRSVIDRMTGRGETMLVGMLWQNLAMIYSSRLGDAEAAAHAFERASELAMGHDE